MRSLSDPTGVGSPDELQTPPLKAPQARSVNHPLLGDLEAAPCVFG